MRTAEHISDAAAHCADFTTVNEKGSVWLRKGGSFVAWATRRRGATTSTMLLFWPNHILKLHKRVWLWPLCTFYMMRQHLTGFFSWHFPELLRSLCMWEQMLPPPSPLVKFFCFLCLKIAIARSNSKPDNVFGANSGATFLLDICTSNRATCRIVEQPGCCPLTLTYCWLCDTHTLTPLLGEVVWSYWCRSNLVFTLQRYVIIFDNAARAIIAPDEWILRSVN